MICNYNCSYNRVMEFEWDEAKRESNVAKHGIDFIRAKLVFDGRLEVTRRSAYLVEERFISIGIVEGHFITVVWTKREENIRLISARRARNEEKREYRSIHSSRDR